MPQFPISIQEWIADKKRENPDGDHHWQQHLDLIDFTLRRALFGNPQSRDLPSWKVIGLHTARNLNLPILQIAPTPDSLITARTDYSGWMVSVRLPRPLNVDLMRLNQQDIGKKIDALACEGFPPELIFNPYPDDLQQFMVSIYHDQELFTLFWRLADHHGWHSLGEH